MTHRDPKPENSWTPEMIEEDRLDNLCSPLFDMFLAFERTFAAKAIDELNVTDEDAEKFATHMAGTEAGRAFGYLLRHIRHERNIRRVGHACAAISAANGGTFPRAMSISEVADEYAKIQKGNA